MRTWVVVLVTVAAIIVGLLLLSCVGAVIFFAWESRPPQNINVEVRSPDQIVVGEPFEFEVHIHNSADHAQSLYSIDVDARLFESVEVHRTAPASRGPFDLPLDGVVWYDFMDMAIDPHETLVITFEATGKQPGAVWSYLDVCINGPGSFLTAHFDLTFVEPAEEP